MAVDVTDSDQTRTTPVYTPAAGDLLTVGPDAVLATHGGSAAVVDASGAVAIQLLGDGVGVNDIDGIQPGAGSALRIEAGGSMTAGSLGIELAGAGNDTLPGGLQDVTWIGPGAFGGVAGQLRLVAGVNVATVQADTNGDSAADLVIQLHGTIALAETGFVL